MRISVARLAVAAVTSAPLAASLFVSPDSPCAKYCGNVLSKSSGDEMACDPGSLSQTSSGVVWEQCIRCLVPSPYASGSPSDMQALLYNLRFNMNYCLWTKIQGQCITSRACQPLEDAINYKNMTTSVGAYDYCSIWEQDVPARCSPCLLAIEDGSGIYLNNYLQILEGACEQKPAPGSTLSINGDPFSSTTPVAVVPPSPTYSFVPTQDYGPISLGARVGIAFGGLAFLLALAGFCIVCNGKRRRRAYLRELERRNGGQGWPHPKTRYGGSGSGGQDMFETPVSQRPLRGWDNDSPLSAHPDGSFPRYFSPYSSQYNSPVTGPEGAGSANKSHQWPPFAPQQPQQQQQHQQALDQLIQTQSPAHGSPPPAFSQWPTATQEKLLMQVHAHHEQRQNELAIGLALGGDEASLRSKASGLGLNANGYPIESKGKGRERDGEEEYELHDVETPSSSSGVDEHAGRNQYGEYQARGGYRMPAEPQAPVLHHPGYGRHHGGRTGSSGTGASAAVDELWR